jgi:O-succinylhomoserine sulfhydrylase
VMKNAAWCLAPFNAWVVLKGLETLDIRMRAQSDQGPCVGRIGWKPTRPLRAFITPA